MIYKKSTAFFAFLVMLILLAASVSMGAYRSWAVQKAEVEQNMGSLLEMLTARREIGSNILSVAKRHLDANDELIKNLQSDIVDLAKTGSFSGLAKANERFERDAHALLGSLKLQPSLQSDKRDLMYTEQMLPQALEKSARMTEQTEYNMLAEAFNTRLSKSFSGRIAHLFGIKPAQQFVDSEVAK